MTVERDDLEAMLEELRRDIRDPREGLFGPRSRMWQFSRESILFLGGARAALLQLAHPFIGQAIEEHSDTQANPGARFVRTFERVFAMVFGDFDEATQASRRVHALHRTIKGKIPVDVGAHAAGSLYEANEEGALLWVHATLWDSAVQSYELLVRPMTRDEKAGYYAEANRFAALFGIPKSILPQTYEAFEAYMQRMLDSRVIVVSPAARRIGDFLMRTPARVAAPVWRWYRAFTAGLLPPRLREEFGLPFGVVEKALFRASIPPIRAAYGALPESLRTLPAYRAAMRRVAGETSVPVVDRVLLRVEHAVEGMTRRRGRGSIVTAR